MEVGGLSVWDAMNLHGMYDVPTLQRYFKDLCHQNADILLHLSRLLLRAQSKNPKVVMSFLMIFSYFFFQRTSVGNPFNHQVGFFGLFDKNA